MKTIKKYIALTLVAVLFINANFTVTFLPNEGEHICSVSLVQSVPQNGAAVAPRVTRDGFVFDGWDTDFSDVTEDIDVTAQWLRIGALSTGGTGHITSMDVTHLARHIVGHYGFQLPDRRLGNLSGANRPPNMGDVTLMAQWLVGYEFDDLREQANIPHIEVLTPFPDGETPAANVFFDYIAVPSEGAEIELVTYTRNGQHGGTLWPGGVGSTLDGIEGHARIPFTMGENQITITVWDSSGRSACYAVPEVPYKISLNISAPSSRYEPYQIHVEGNDETYAANRIVLWAVRAEGMCRISAGITPERIAEAVADIDGVIIGQFPDTGRYVIRVPAQDSLEDLNALGERMLAEYPDLFQSFLLSLTNTILTPGIYTDDAWWTQTRDRGWWHLLPFRRYIPYQWGLTAVNLPQAWEASRFDKNHQRNNIKVGILDSNVFAEHPDLLIPTDNINNSKGTYDEKGHGTNVAGVLASIHNNQIGLAGATNISRNAIYVYNIHRRNPFSGNLYIREDIMIEGLEWLVINGAKIINSSTHSNRRTVYNADTIDLSNKMAELLALGYDFVLVQIAGQPRKGEPAIDVKYSAVFTHEHLVAPRDMMKKIDLDRRTITVGATTRDGRVAPWSNYGSAVDIIAPGEDIYTTCDVNHEDYGFYNFVNGTSFSAPIVAGIIHLMWEENPALSGDRLKMLLVGESPLLLGTPMNDNRDLYVSIRGSQRQVCALTAIRNAQNPLPWYTFDDARLVGQVLAAQEGSAEPIPVAYADIEHFRIINGRMTSTGTTRTQSQGFYRIDNIPEPAIKRIRISADDYNPVRFYLAVTQKGVTTHLKTIRLVPKPENAATGGITSGRLIGARESASASPSFMPLDDTFIGNVRMEFISGIYDIEPHMLECDDWLEVLDLEIIKTLNVSDGNYRAELPSGNYTVIVSGQLIYTTIAHVISHWDDHEYWLNQDITIRPRIPKDITYAFKCPHFLAFVRERLSKGQDEPVYDYEVADIIWLNLSRHRETTSIAGIEYFTSLQNFCIHSTFVTHFDFSNNKDLIYLCASENQLTHVNLSNNPNLQVLYVDGNNLTHLDLTNNPNLQYLYLHNNSLTHLDLSNNPNLLLLYIQMNYIPSFDYVIGWQNINTFSFSPQKGDIDFSAHEFHLPRDCYSRSCMRHDEEFLMR
jgi:hypothetical protein